MEKDPPPILALPKAYQVSYHIKNAYLHTLI
jgi:hypothetical protein